MRPWSHAKDCDWCRTAKPHYNSGTRDHHAQWTILREKYASSGNPDTLGTMLNWVTLDNPPSAPRETPEPEAVSPRRLPGGMTVIQAIWLTWLLFNVIMTLVILI